MESKQCARCKKTILLEEFKSNKRTVQYIKMCITCLDKSKKYREKTKCIHGKQKAHCRDLECKGGIAFCMHGKEKAHCRDPICKGG